jgi:hypothetical protein
MGDSILTIEPFRLCRLIVKMLNLPPFLRREVNPTGRRGFNAMLS